MIKNQITLYFIISVFFIQLSLPCFAMQDTEDTELQKRITAKQELPFQDKDPSWIFMLGVSLFKGENEQIKNYEQAAACWKLASLRGHAKSQCFLGEAYRRGLGVPQDNIKAKEYFQMAADQGNEEAKEALNKYYSLFNEGKIVITSPEMEDNVRYEQELEYMDPFDRSSGGDFCDTDENAKEDWQSLIEKLRDN